MKIYLDTSVYNRPFDDQSQPRIHLEAIGFVIVLQLIEAGEIDLVVSSVNEFENSRNPFEARRAWVNRWFKLAKLRQSVNEPIRQRAKEIERQGIKALDALHLSCAEQSGCNWFLTCDDKLQRKYSARVMTVADPVNFILQVP
jgi:predicted nucleic acid-binding protein